MGLLPDIKSAPLLHGVLHLTMPFFVLAIFLGLSCIGHDHPGRYHAGNADFEVWPSFDHTSYGWPLTAVRTFKVHNDLTIPGRFDFFGIILDLTVMLIVMCSMHVLVFLLSRPAKGAST